MAISIHVSYIALFQYAKALLCFGNHLSFTDECHHPLIALHNGTLNKVFACTTDTLLVINFVLQTRDKTRVVL